MRLLYFFIMWRIHYDKNLLWQEISKISKPQSLDILVRQFLLIILLMTTSASILGFRHYNTFPALLLLPLSITFDPFPDVSSSPPSTVHCESLPGSLQPQGGMSSATVFVGTALAQGSQHSGRSGTMATEGKRKQVPCFFSRILSSDEHSQP